MKDKNDLKLLDVMCKWYIWAVVGMVIVIFLYIPTDKAS